MHEFKESLIATLASLTGLQAYGAILGVLFICGLGVPIPEDITLISAGVLAALKSISLPGALVAGFVGVLIGDALLFMVGRKFGRRVFDSRLLNRIFGSHRLALAEQKVLRNSRFICFTARFLPGLRAPIYLVAGAIGVKPIIFFALDSLAALLSVPVWVLLGYWFGNNIDQMLDIAKKAQLYVLIGVVVLIVGYLIYRKIRKRNQTEANPG